MTHLAAAAFQHPIARDRRISTLAPPRSADRLRALAHVGATSSWLLLLVLLPVAVDPSGAFGVEPVKASLLRCLAALICGAWFAGRLLRGEARAALSSNAVVRAGSVMLAAASASTLLSADPLTSFFGTFERSMGWLSLAAGVVLLISGAALLVDNGFRERAISALLFGAILPCAYAVVQTLGRDPIHWDGVLGVVSSLGSPTFLGGFLVLVLPFALYRMVTTGHAVLCGAAAARMRYAGYLTLASLICAVVLRIAVRGSVLALVVEVAGFSWLMFRGRRLSRRTCLTAAAVCSVALGAIVVVGGQTGLPVARRFLDAANPTTHAGGSVSERLELWRAAAPLPMADPLHALVGFGPEMQTAAFEQSAGVVSISPGEQFDRAHNLFLDTWLTGGALGELSLLAVICAATVSAWQACRRATRPSQKALAAAVLAALAGHLVDQQFAFESVVTGTWFWVVVGLAASLNAPRSAPMRQVSVPHWKQWSAAAVVGISLVVQPALAAPALADALQGAALAADARGDRARAASLASFAATWAPWIEEPAELAGIELQALGLDNETSRGDEALAQAEVRLRQATSRAAWDPYTHLALAQLYRDWAQRPSTSRDPAQLMAEGREACRRALLAGPFRTDEEEFCASDLGVL